MTRVRSVMAVAICIALLILTISGCGKKKDGTSSDGTEGRPESVTAYEAYQYSKPAADKWEKKNWVIDIRDGDPSGLNKFGKAKIWEVYFFSPRPETYNQFMVIYNRGNVWPNTPTRCRGLDSGTKVYRKNKPDNFKVDSSEAYNVALRNGGGSFMEAHEDAKVKSVLRCKADYEASDADMPAPGYQWIWDITYELPQTGSEIFRVMVDGINGDFITKETKRPGEK